MPFLYRAERQIRRLCVPHGLDMLSLCNAVPVPSTKLDMQAVSSSTSGHIVALQVHELSESLLFGWPNILIPHADSFDSIQDMEANEQCFTGLCQVSVSGTML